MTISGRIFRLLDKKGMTQKEFSLLTGIPSSTISDWKKKNTNPAADKIMDICYALDVTPEQLLTGVGIDDPTEDKKTEQEQRLSITDKKLLREYHQMRSDQKMKLYKYIESLKNV